jgi:hypothetical protein
MICCLVRMARWTALALMPLGAPIALAAQDSANDRNHLYDTFQASVNFTTVINRSDARLDGSNGEFGTTLDLREMLGVSGTTVQPALGFRWKPGRHTEFDASYQFLNSSGQRSFSDTLRIGDDTVSGSIDANTRASSNNAILQFKYSIWAAERHNIGAAVGLGAVFLSLRIDATATGCAGPDCTSGSLSVDKSLVGPTAAIGAFGQWRVGNRWYVGATAGGIGAHVDRFDFSVFQGNVAGEYFFSDRWGIEAGVYYTDVTVDVAPKSGGAATGDLVGRIKYAYSSFRLGLVGAF